jgi:hypothetical protein
MYIQITNFVKIEMKMGKNKYTYSYSKLVHNILKPKQKAFAGAMTSIVKYVTENMAETIRFRSVSGDQGTVSSVKIQGAKDMIYASCQGADAFKAFAEEHPRYTLVELKNILPENCLIELREIVNFFCDKGYSWKVPIVQLDTDKIKDI